MVTLNSKNIVGSPSLLTWSQAQSLTDQDSSFYVVVKLTLTSNEEGVDLPTTGSSLLQVIEEQGMKSISPQLLQQAMETIVAGVPEAINIDLLVARVNKEEVTLYAKGDVDAYLSRNETLAKLMQGGDEGRILEGKLQNLDVMVLATAQLVSTIGVAKFREIITLDDDPSELITPLVHSEPDSSGIAATIVQVEVETVKNDGSWWKSIKTKMPTIALRNEAPRKMNLWIGGVMFLLLISMIGVGMVRRTKVISETAYLSLEMSVNTKLDETILSGNLNPEKSRTLLMQARSEVDAYLSGEVKDEYRAKATQLLVKIEEADLKAFKKSEISLQTIVELSILDAQLQSDKMKSDGKGNIIFLDPSAQKIVSMNLVDRSKQVIESEEDEDYIDVGVSEAKLYGLRVQGVDELFWKRDLVTEKIKADEFWKQPEQIELFAGNIYILDTEQSEIWKYSVLGESFAERKRWLAASITPDLTNVVDMKVVGDIWLLTSTGKLERYSRGAPVTFSMEGFPAQAEPKKLSKPSALWVTDSLIYVLENGAERVVVFNDDGGYESQYVNSEFGRATDLVIVDDKGYVLIDNAVKEFGL